MDSAKRHVRRLCWLILAAAALVLYLFVNRTVTRCLLVPTLCLPLLSLTSFLLPRPKLSASLQLPVRLSRGQPAEAQLTVRSDSLLPQRVRVSLVLRNEFTCEEQPLSLYLSLRRGKAVQKSICFLPQHCGMLTILVCSAALPDPLGLVEKQLSLKLQTAAPVMPVCHPVTVMLSDTADLLQDSARYTAQRPGYDPAETVCVREYVPGDPIRQIHWKLTEKTDKLLLREFGLPQLSSLLLLFETVTPAQKKPDGADVDALLDLLYGVASALLAAEQPFTLGWQAVQGDFISYEIDRVPLLESALLALLQTPLRSGESSVAGCFAAQQTASAFAHTAVFSTWSSPDLRSVCHGSPVTLLLPASCSAEAESAVTHVVCFQAQTTHLEL